MKRCSLLKAFALTATVASLGFTFGTQAADTIKVGILSSLSGTIAISEAPLKDMALMTINEINAQVGVLGQKLKPVVVNPASNWPLSPTDQTSPDVGQLAGTVVAAFGLGILDKVLEPQIGAVLGKILILVLIVLFIQKRPQGLFAFKGRVID